LPALEHDLPCPNCGYNLRGLSGDPVRCPECGVHTAVSLATRSEYARDDLLRARLLVRFHAGPSLCALGAGAAAFFFGLFAALHDFFWPIRTAPYVTCAVVWITGATVYVAQCRRLPGWRRAFVRHQAYALSAVLGNLGLIFGAFLLAFGALSSAEGPPCGLPLALVAAVFGVIVLRPMWWFDRRAKAQLEPLVQAELRRTATEDDASPAQPHS
jgi:hypothetical protein